MEELLELIEQVKDKRDQLSEYLEQLTQKYQLNRQRPINCKAIMNIVCKYFNVTEAQLKGSSRLKNIKTARFFFCYLSRKHTRKTLLEVGSMINREHASVLNAQRKTEHFIKNYDEDKLMAEKLEMLITEYKFRIG